MQGCEGARSPKTCTLYVAFDTESFLVIVFGASKR